MTFELSSQSATILGDQSPDDFTVTYHISQDDANNTASTGLASPYTNSKAGGEKIYVRVLNKSSGCFRATTSFDIEGTNTAGNFGVAGNVTYLHRNLFISLGYIIVFI